MRSFFKEKFANFITTILIAVIAFSAREYYVLNSKIFEKLLELSDNQQKKIQEVSERQNADHTLILDIKSDIHEIKVDNASQEEAIYCIQEELYKLR